MQAHAIGTHLVAPSSEFILAQQRVLARVVETMEKLPPRRRQVFLLFRAYGHTRAEIAQQLDITEMAVAKHLLRATIDCSRVFAELRAELIEPQHVQNHAGFDTALAEDFSAPRERLIERALALIVEGEIAPGEAAQHARMAMNQWRSRSPEHAAALLEARHRWDAL
eukprot:gene31135-41482_t